MKADVLSIAIETVKHIEIRSYSGAYGSVYLNYDKSSPRQSSKDIEPYRKPGAVRHTQNEAARASVPIARTDSIWASMSTWQGWLGFYGFKGFDEFANIINGRQERRCEFQGDS